MNATAIHQARSARTEQILKALCAGVLVLIVAGAILTSVFATSNTSRAALHTTRSPHVAASAPTPSTVTPVGASRILPTISNGPSSAPASETGTSNQTGTSDQTGPSSSGSATETCLGATSASLEQAVTQTKLPEYLGAEIATPNEVTVTAVIDPQDPCWGRYSIGPAPGYRPRYKGPMGSAGTNLTCPYRKGRGVSPTSARPMWGAQAIHSSFQPKYWPTSEVALANRAWKRNTRSPSCVIRGPLDDHRCR